MSLFQWFHILCNSLSSVSCGLNELVHSLTERRDQCRRGWACNDVTFDLQQGFQLTHEHRYNPQTRIPIAQNTLVILNSV